MKTKSFPLRTVLTVTTGRLLTKPTSDGNGIGDLYEILGWMTGEPPFTYQLGRFSEECRPALLESFPELRCVGSRGDGDFTELEKLIKENGQQGIEMWLGRLQTQFPEIKDSYEVPKTGPRDHVSINPMDELAAMMDKKGEAA